MAFCIQPRDVLHPDGWLYIPVFPTVYHINEGKYDNAKKSFYKNLDEIPNNEFFDWLKNNTNRMPIIRTIVTGSYWPYSKKPIGWNFKIELLISPEDIPYYILKFK